MIYTKEVSTALWYLYLYLGILIMMPLLQKLVLNMKNYDFYYFMFWSILFMGTIPIIEHYKPEWILYKFFSIPMFAVSVGLLFAGYYIDNLEKLKKTFAFTSVLLIVILTFVTVTLTYREYIISSDDFLFYDNRELITTTGCSLGIFYIVKYLFENIKLSERVEQYIFRLGNLTFGIYLLSDFLIEKGRPVRNILETLVNPLIAVGVYQVIIFVLGALVTLLLKRVPGVNKFI